jgi:hypothetical protein
VALLSIAVELVFGALERVVVSAGLKAEQPTADVHLQERPR